MVYDSLYTSIGTFVQKQITTLHRTMEEVKVNIMNMQVQAGTCDCGLFAIATATSLLNSTNPGAITYSLRWNVIYMTPPAGGRFAPFLVLKTRRSSSKIKYSKSFPVYCICRLIESADHGMVECSKCFDWFYADCLEEAVPQDALEDNKVDLYCSRCSQ